MLLITKGPLRTPHSLIIRNFSKGRFYPYTCKGFNLPQTIGSLRGIPRIPVYDSIQGFEAANPKPYLSNRHNFSLYEL
jgi:hypothetical protein